MSSKSNQEEVKESIVEAVKSNVEPTQANNGDAMWMQLLLPITIFLSTIIIVSTVLFSLFTLTSNSDKNFVALNSAIAKIQVAGTASAAATEEKTPTLSESDLTGLLADNTYMTVGNKNAKLHFVEFSDPSCPYCHIAGGYNTQFNKTGRFQTIENGGTYVAPLIEIKKLVDQNKASFTLVYTVGHGAGELGAQAWYCGFEKGKFWEVHDSLMTSEAYDLLNNEIKNDVANSAKLAEFLSPVIDKTFMTECLSSKKYASKLQSDMQYAQARFVQGTPGFFVNTVAFPGAYSFTDMKSTVDQYL